MPCCSWLWPARPGPQAVPVSVPVPWQQRSTDACARSTAVCEGAIQPECSHRLSIARPLHAIAATHADCSLLLASAATLGLHNDSAGVAKTPSTFVKAPPSRSENVTPTRSCEAWDRRDARRDSQCFGFHPGISSDSLCSFGCICIFFGVVADSSRGDARSSESTTSWQRRRLRGATRRRCCTCACWCWWLRRCPQQR